MKEVKEVTVPSAVSTFPLEASYDFAESAWPAPLLVNSGDKEMCMVEVSMTVASSDP